MRAVASLCPDGNEGYGILPGFLVGWVAVGGLLVKGLPHFNEFVAIAPWGNDILHHASEKLCAERWRRIVLKLGMVWNYRFSALFSLANEERRQTSTSSIPQINLISLLLVPSFFIHGIYF